MRKGNVINILAACKDRLEAFGIRKLVQCGSLGDGAASHFVEKAFKVGIFAHIVEVFFIVYGIGHFYEVQPQFFNGGVPQLAIGIAK